MSTLLLVRHGQASFLSEDYDRLSTLGEAQAVLLGQAWRSRGVRVDRVFTGSLKRQRDTAALACDALGQRADHEVLPELDEYPSEALVAHARDTADAAISLLLEVEPELDSRAARARTAERVIRSVMERWVEGTFGGAGIETFPEFAARVAAAVDVVTRGPRGQHVVAFTSGGVIGAAVAGVLGAPSRSALELGYALHNASVSELVFSPGRLNLRSFNATPHFNDPSHFTFR